MKARSGGVTKRLLEKLLKDQERRVNRERKMPYAQKLRMLDQLMAGAVQKVEPVARQHKQHKLKSVPSATGWQVIFS